MQKVFGRRCVSLMWKNVESTDTKKLTKFQSHNETNDILISPVMSLQLFIPLQRLQPKSKLMNPLTVSKTEEKQTNDCVSFFKTSRSK